MIICAKKKQEKIANTIETTSGTKHIGTSKFSEIVKYLGLMRS